MNLAKHGTVPCALTARALVQTAQQDLLARRQNRAIKAAKTALKKAATLHDKETARENVWLDETMRKIAFDKADVEAGDTPADIIRSAIANRRDVLLREEKRQSLVDAGAKNAPPPMPVNTYRIYADEDRLREALEIAEAL